MFYEIHKFQQTSILKDLFQEFLISQKANFNKSQ